jgi:hypothetical protein
VTPLNEIKIDIFGAFLQNVLNDSNARSGVRPGPEKIKAIFRSEIRA